MGRNILLVATVASFIKAFEMNDIAVLQNLGCTVHVATNINEHNPSEEKTYFSSNNILLHPIDFERFPFKISNLKAIKQMRTIIRENKIELIHCHTRQRSSEKMAAR